MNRNELIKKINNFYKSAGTLEYPVKMHQEIFKWATSVYCAFVMDELNDIVKSQELSENTLKKINAFRGMLRKQITVRPEIPKNFKINLDDISFLEEEVKNLKDKKSKILNDTITVFFFPYLEGEDRGRFNAGTNTIEIFEEIDPQISFENLEFSLKRISNSIRHELQHLTQHYSQILKGIKDFRDIGMPSTKISPHQTVQEREELPYHLLNNEFYTDLSDSISSVKELFRIFPKILWRDILNVFIGVMNYEEFHDKAIKTMNLLNSDEILDDDDFNERYGKYLDDLDAQGEGHKLMSTQQPEKYEKFVKELYKAVSDYL